MRQPGRHLYSNLTEHSFSGFCDDVLSTDNVLLKNELGEHKVIDLEWDLCMAYEFELRREAVGLITEEKSFQRKSAVWSSPRTTIKEWNTGKRSSNSAAVCPTTSRTKGSRNCRCPTSAGQS